MLAISLLLYRLWGLFYGYVKNSTKPSQTSGLPVFKLSELLEEADDFDKQFIEPKNEDIQSQEKNIEEVVDNLITKDLLIGSEVIIKDIKALLKLENWCEIVTCLVKRGLDVNTKYYLEPDKHVNLLVIASCFNNKNLVELLVENGAKVDEPDSQGWIPLFNAIGNQNKEMADFLLEKGTSINYISKDNKTPLCFAMDKGYEDMWEWLIQKGANINESNAHGNIALQHAVERRNRKAVKVLLKEGLDVTNETYALNLAIGSDALPIAKLLIKSGVDINKPVKDEETPLGIAAYILNQFTAYDGFHPVREIIKLLVKKKADPNVKVNNQYSILALVIDDLEIAKCLLKHGANPNVMIEQIKMSLLATLVEKDEKESVKLLLQYGADVNLVLPDRFTALFYAKSKEMAELLLDKGANINYQDTDGITALSAATIVENKDVVEVLISRGADVNQISFGESTLSLAKSSGNKEIIDLIEKKQLSN